MTLYFLRHAEAVDHAASDEARELTPKGRNQAERAGHFLKKAKVAPTIILASPVLRAAQTAEIVGKIAGLTPVETPWLACGMSPEELLEGIRPHLSGGDILLVGHEPDFSHAISTLVGMENLWGIHIGRASLTAVELPRGPHPCAQLRFLVPSRLM